MKDNNNIESAPVEKFQLTYGGFFMNVIIILTATITFTFLSAIFYGIISGNIWRGDVGDAFMFLGAFLLFVMFPSFVLYYFMKNIINRDPRIIFNGKDLLLFVSGETWKIIDSNWFEFSHEERLRQPYIKIVIDHEIDDLVMLWRKPALAGRYQDGIVLSSYSFRGGSENFREKMSMALDVMKKRKEEG